MLARDAPPTRRQRGLFVGALWNDDTDGWSVRQEFRSLKKSLAGLSDLIEVESVYANDADGVRERVEETETPIRERREPEACSWPWRPIGLTAAQSTELHGGHRNDQLPLLDRHRPGWILLVGGMRRIRDDF